MHTRFNDFSVALPVHGIESGRPSVGRIASDAICDLRVLSCSLPFLCIHIVSSWSKSY